MLGILGNPYAPDYREKADNYSLAFLIIGIGAFLCNAASTFASAIVGNSLTNKLRNELYKKILRMPVAWFDEEKNNAGALAVKVGVDCSLVN